MPSWDFCPVCGKTYEVLRIDIKELWRTEKIRNRIDLIYVFLWFPISVLLSVVGIFVVVLLDRSDFNSSKYDWIPIAAMVVSLFLTIALCQVHKRRKFPDFFTHIRRL
ncbi:hypothetical protein KW791_01640 [Candidatus Parcubacteria bacterium]|nr:hypothetical protein [Candidatus Parcubacteria bacterium]